LEPPLESPLESPLTPEEFLNHLHAGHFALAFTLAEKLALAEPESPVAHRHLAMAHLALGRPEEALESLDVCLELHEQFPNRLDTGDLANVYATRALVQLQQDELLDAEEDAKKALQLHPEEPDALFVSMVTAVDGGRLAEAHAQAVRLVAFAPESPDAHAWLARILSLEGKRPEAAQAAQRARALGFSTSELERIEAEGPQAE